MRQVFVLGSLNADLVISTPKMPRAGETVMGSNFLVNPGGKGANQAVASARQGAKVTMIGAVGNDAYGNELIENLAVNQVNTDSVVIKENENTGVAIIVIASQDNRIIVDPGSNNSLTKKNVSEVIEKQARKNDFLVVQLEVPIETVKVAMSIAKNIGMVVVFNPAPMNREACSFFSLADYVILNEIEAEMITEIKVDQTKPESVLKKCFDMGIKVPIITMGEHGLAYLYKGQVIQVHSIEAEVVDTTAAGDAFVGALTAYLSKDIAFPDAIVRANVAAGLTVTKRGAQGSIPSFDEVQWYLENGGKVNESYNKRYS